MPYKPIESYGVIGNMHTAALVGMDGSIDWLCFPHFDSPSCFAAILDDKKGGAFRISPEQPGATRKQFYWPETNILVTRFMSPDGVGKLVDFMPVGLGEGHPWAHSLIRFVDVDRGTMRFRMECRPAFNYALDPHKAVIGRGGVRFLSRRLRLDLTSRVPMRKQGGAAIAEFVLREGQRAVFALTGSRRGALPSRVLSNEEGYDLFKNTVEYWYRWISRCTYHGRWREIVQRSALLLKLLTFEPTGAIVASPTCSLPESIGGGRNWDYRYTWIRDAAFTLYALMRIGLTDEATRFMGWLEARVHELKSGIPLQVMYGIEGRHDLAERTLDHLEGYRGSRPVRVGNAAHDQLQLDIYGELMDSVYLYNKYGSPIAYELWTRLRYLTDWVCEHWREADAGIWEVRGAPRQFTYSKLMCWVAVDRALRLAEKRSFPAHHALWLRSRDDIYEAILEKGFSRRRRAFAQSFESETLDASNLMMPLVFFLSPNDPKMLSTLDAIKQTPARGGLSSASLVYRYDVWKAKDGLLGNEGSFNICTFWMVEAMTRAGKLEPARLAEARLVFEQMLGYANHLGLYAEQIGPTGEAVGNFPQAFTHLSLISAAFNLDRSLGSGPGQAP